MNVCIADQRKLGTTLEPERRQHVQVFGDIVRWPAYYLLHQLTWIMVASRSGSEVSRSAVSFFSLVARGFIAGDFLPPPPQSVFPR